MDKYYFGVTQIITTWVTHATATWSSTGRSMMFGGGVGR